MLKLKAPLIIAGVSCILSMLIGVISGVRLLSILLRGLVTGIGVGGFAFGARLLLEKFIPDLFVPQPSQEAADTMTGTSTANVNIVLDEDSEEADTEQTYPVAENTDAKQTEAGATEVEQETHIKEENKAASPDKPQGDNPNNTAPQPNSDAQASSDTDNARKSAPLSNLPDMGSFIEDEEDTDGNEGESSNETIPISSGESFSVNSLQTDNTDSKVMAQAIRTVLAAED